MTPIGAARDNKNNKINNLDVPPDTTVDGMEKNIKTSPCHHNIITNNGSQREHEVQLLGRHLHMY
jgi:hypothetical protein